jgi:hypothetical protein
VKAHTAGQLVRFRGNPTRVEGFIQIPYDSSIAYGRLAAHIQANDKTHDAITLQRPYVQSVPVGDGTTRFVLRLPESTPPRTYSGTLEVGHETYPMEVIVESRPWLTLMPRRTSLAVAPGHEEVVELTAVNRGNRVCDVPEEGIVNLFDSAALSVAVTAALSSKDKGQDRVNRFADTVAKHADVLNLVVVDGAGAMHPGETRRLSVRLHVPKGLQAGHTYNGGWEMPNSRYVIEVYVLAAEPKEAKAS